MTTFRDILDKNECYILYISRSFSRKMVQKNLCNFYWYKIAYVNKDNFKQDGISLDANSFCLLDGSYEIYTDKNDVIARMKDAVMEGLEKGGCSMTAIRKMVQAKWRKWLI